MRRPPRDTTPAPEDDSEAYQVDLATALFALMLIFLVITMAQERASTDPARRSDYTTEDSGGEPYPLASFRPIYRFYDYWVWRDGRLTRLDLGHFARILAGSPEPLVSDTLEQGAFALSAGRDSAPSSFALQLVVADGAPLPAEWTTGTVDAGGAGGTDAVLAALAGGDGVPHVYVWRDQLQGAAPVLDALRRQGRPFRYEVVSHATLTLRRDAAQFGLEEMAR